MSTKRVIAALATILLPIASAGCAEDASPSEDFSRFPPVERPVSAIVSNEYSDEASREKTGEAETVISILGIEEGETVADIGAGRGYYMQKLASAVGPAGRVYAEDIVPDVVSDLSVRASANGFSNVRAVLGTPSDPRLPADSLDHAILIHMYHEIENPYALMWHLRASLKPQATIAVVDANRITSRHGTPPALLACELEALGFEQVAQSPLESERFESTPPATDTNDVSNPAAGELAPGQPYLAIFRTVAPRPAPEAIEPCRNPQ